MEITQPSASTHSAVPPPPSPRTATHPGAVEPVTPPPKGGLPGSQQVLSQLTPGDRAAIAGATGYQLSPNGAITNVGGMPPWSFIMAFAASRTAAQPAEEVAKAPEDGGHVDVTV